MKKACGEWANRKGQSVVTWSTPLCVTLALSYNLEHERIYILKELFKLMLKNCIFN